MLNPWLVASSAIALTTKLAIEFVPDEYKVPITYANVSLPIASVSVLYLLYKLDKLLINDNENSAAYISDVDGNNINKTLNDVVGEDFYISIPKSSITTDKIKIKAIREVNKDVIIMVDNCYGEFVEEKEPTEVGADIIVGSLMKNLGAGIATSGAYIAGKKGLIELCAERLTANSFNELLLFSLLIPIIVCNVS